VTSLDAKPRPDPRLNAWRADLAAESLRGVVSAPRYAAGEARRVTRSVLPLRSAPRNDTGLDNQVLFGERVRVYDADATWAWCQLERDGYVGYVPAQGLAEIAAASTHRVRALGACVYAEADIKSQALIHVPMNSFIAVEKSEDRFLKLADGGWMVARQLAEINRYAPDFVEVAERFIAAPYLWGGRTAQGLDCSALVQLSMEAAGLACPRDSDLQQKMVGTEVLVPTDLEGLQRGDLVFWRGHVGIMTDGVMLLHANAHHMAVVAEPLHQAAGRIAGTGSTIASVRRPAALSASSARQ
jgi:cell wall-associated NlpC family hydrolase